MCDDIPVSHEDFFLLTLKEKVDQTEIRRICLWKINLRPYQYQWENDRWHWSLNRKWYFVKKTREQESTPSVEEYSLSCVERLLVENRDLSVKKNDKSR